MSKRKPTPKEVLADAVNELTKCYLHWKDLYFNGGSDPAWEDGYNLNLTRNHVLWYRSVIEDTLKDDVFSYPDCYFWPIMPRVPDTYMGRSRIMPSKDRKIPVLATEKPFVISW